MYFILFIVFYCTYFVVLYCFVLFSIVLYFIVLYVLFSATSNLTPSVQKNVRLKRSTPLILQCEQIVVFM